MANPRRKVAASTISAETTDGSRIVKSERPKNTASRAAVQ
jgi:hypothetical protein